MSRYCTFILAALVTVGAATRLGAADRLTVGDVAKGLALDEAKLTHVDEPPGKLQALECDTTLPNTSAKVRVRIEVVYTPALFSDQRKWDAKAVRVAAVSRVTITPITGR
ncbi:MAG: hypothetical protein ACJ8F7_17595 [Gemmataceae bacterium]